MKNKILSIFAVLITLICVGCSNSSNSEDKERIAQLEEQIKELQSSKNENSNTPYGNNETNITYSGQDLQEKVKPQISEYIGKFEMTDEAGQVFIITVNADETATIELQGGSFKGYGSWNDFPYDYPDLSFSRDDSPNIYFPSGKEHYFPGLILCEGWAYDGSSAFKAKNPNKRLPIKKIK